MKIWFFEALDVALANFESVARQERRGKCKLLTVVSPPPHEFIDVTGITGLELFLDRKLDGTVQGTPFPHARIGGDASFDVCVAVSTFQDQAGLERCC